jgi:hypothetical protein
MGAVQIRIVLGGSKRMTCAEFQRDLPEFIDAGGSADASEHLQHCSICSDLVEDLKYIAEAAKLLLPMHEPSPRVWEGIQSSIKNQPKLRPAGGPGRPEPFLVPAPHSQTSRWIALAGVAVLVLALIAYQAISRTPAAPSNTTASASAAPDLEPSDQQVLSELSARRPEMRATYEQGFRDVNAYIRAARRQVQEHPGDPDAASHLMNAYEQKAALYEMASTSP